MKLHRVSSCQFFVFWIFTKMRVRGGVEDERKREQRANQRNLEWKKGLKKSKTVKAGNEIVNVFVAES